MIKNIYLFKHILTLRIASKWERKYVNGNYFTLAFQVPFYPAIFELQRESQKGKPKN